MAQGLEQIGKKDVIWSYGATITTIGAGLILLPFILHKMPAETVGIWSIFQTITLLVTILDFGFRPSFARNISYIFSGVKTLQKEGVSNITQEPSLSPNIDYLLLKGTIHAMRTFYRWLALSVLLLLLTAGTAYFWSILKKYNGDFTDAIAAWIILVLVNCYNLYTLYWDSLLLGKGYVMKSQQINIIAQATYLTLAIILIYCGLGLSAIVTAQLVAYIIRRTLSKKVFYTTALKETLQQTCESNHKEILRIITPNAIRIGFTNIGGFVVTKSALLIGAAYLSLQEIAAYGITMQVMDVMARCGCVTYQSFVPRLAQCRTEKDVSSLRRYYTYSIYALIVTYIVGGVVLILSGNWVIGLIRSETVFLPSGMLLALLLIQLLEQNHVVAAGFIMSDNKVPFMWPSLISGAATITLLYIFLGPIHMGVWGMILAPGIAQLCYQNWRWPSVVIKELYFLRT